MDMGGLSREFLEAVVAACSDPGAGLMASTPGGLAYPSPLAPRLPGALGALRLLGAALGRALWEGLLVELPLAPFFVAQLQVGGSPCRVPGSPCRVPALGGAGRHIVLRSCWSTGAGLASCLAPADRLRRRPEIVIHPLPCVISSSTSLDSCCVQGSATSF